MTSMITTALLDLDGTVLDSTEFFFAAFAHTAATFDFLIPSREESLKLVGPPLEQLYAQFSDAPMAELCDTHRSFQERNLNLIAAFEGAGAALAQLRERGIAIAAVTTRSNRTSRDSLANAGLLAFFDAVVSAEDSPYHKPDPAPLRIALERLNRGSFGAVMVGDTAADIGAGKALGIPTIGVTYGFAGPAIADHHPDELIHHIRELPATISRISARPEPRRG